MIAPARQAAFGALVAIARGRVDLDAALDRARESLSDGRDIALVRELVTGTLRWQARLDWQLTPLCRVPWRKLDLEVQTVLRLAAFQILELDRVPVSAVVHDAVGLVRQARKTSASGLVNAVLRRLAAGERAPWPQAPADASITTQAAALAVTGAHPSWLVERWLARRDRAAVDAWLAFDNGLPPTTLRVNPLAGVTRDDVIAALAADGVATAPCRYAPLGLVVTAGLAWQSAAVRDGRAFIQDEGSQLAALVAPVRPGHRVLDVCAAPGGKTLAYAAATGPTGRVVACDVRLRRVATLAATVATGRATTVRTVAIDPAAALPFAAVFDVVAVDAPCSGLGTVRRDPDIKWRRTPEDLRAFQARQLDLLDRAARVVAPGGALVYTTCSTEPEENAEVVQGWHAAHPEFVPVSPAAGPHGDLLRRFVTESGTFATDAVRDGLEGYFGAVFVRGTRGRVPVAVVQ
ncbi:MAG: transcription antitermination factor NusB [Vicinamibacterales bacterium]